MGSVSPIWAITQKVKELELFKSSDNRAVVVKSATTYGSATNQCQLYILCVEYPDQVNLH